MLSIDGMDESRADDTLIDNSYSAIKSFKLKGTVILVID